MMTVTDLKIADLIAWEADRDTLDEIAIVLGIQHPDPDAIQNEKYAKVMWNSGNISNVPLKLIYLVNRS